MTRNKELEKALSEFDFCFATEDRKQRIRELFAQLKVEVGEIELVLEQQDRTMKRLVPREKVREMLIHGIGEGYLWDRSSFEREAKRGAFDKAAQRIADSLLEELNT